MQYNPYTGECPCRYCNQRTPDCHGVCEKYIQWNQKNAEYREIKNNKVNQDRIIDEDLIRKRLRRKKRWNILERKMVKCLKK